MEVFAISVAVVSVGSVMPAYHGEGFPSLLLENLRDCDSFFDNRRFLTSHVEVCRTTTVPPGGPVVPRGSVVVRNTQEQISEFHKRCTQSIPRE